MFWLGMWLQGSLLQRHRTKWWRNERIKIAKIGIFGVEEKTIRLVTSERNEPREFQMRT